jgi:hypothetical protein
MGNMVFMQVVFANYQRERFQDFPHPIFPSIQALPARSPIDQIPHSAPEGGFGHGAGCRAFDPRLFAVSGIDGSLDAWAFFLRHSIWKCSIFPKTAFV